MSSTERLTHSNAYTMYPAIAAKDIVRDAILLYVICPELMPHAITGDLAAGKTTGSVTAQGRDGAVVNTQFTSANYIEATWEGQDFVRYPPMVKAGEAVEIYKRPGQDKWTWRSTKEGRMSRTTDRLCFEVSAAPNNTSGSKTDNMTYSFEMNSIDQTITMRTSKANGEGAAFRFGANLKKGTWFATDDQDENNDKTANRFFLDTGAVSKTPTYQINLNTGICLRMVKKDFHLDVPGKAFINIKDRLIIGSPIIMFNPEKAGAFIGKFTSVGWKVSKDFVADVGGVFGVNSKSVKFAGPVIAAGFRGAAFMYGALGGLFRAATLGNAEAGSVSEPGNGADMNVSGSGDKALIACDAVVDAFKMVVAGFSSCMGYSGGANGAPSVAQSGEISSHKGK